MTMKPIPQEWIRDLIDQYLDIAKKLGPNTKMGEAMLLRADHVMDMVKAFRESQETKKEGE